VKDRATSDGLAKTLAHALASRDFLTALTTISRLEAHVETDAEASTLRQARWSVVEALAAQPDGTEAAS